MTAKEKQLFKELCSFKKEKFDERLIKYATPVVLGWLFYNRMQAVAYGILKKHKMLSKLNREIRSSLQNAYEYNVAKNKDFAFCVKYINDMLLESKCNYALLKGAILFQYYPEGYRTSNDIDLLVLPSQVSKIGKILTRNGFQQGYIRDDEFVPATRKEIIESKMMRGETVPYIKKLNLSCMKYLEVDINFSLDYKNGKPDTLRRMLKRAHMRNINGMSIQTIDCEDFFIHLCSHLYKEATTMPWIEMKRDMTLYKYCDIYMLLSNMDKDETSKMLMRAKELSMEKICAFAILQTAKLFELKNTVAINMSEEILRDDALFIHTVFSPKEKKKLVYEKKDIRERFFSNNRVGLLRSDKNG